MTPTQLLLVVAMPADYYWTRRTRVSLLDLFHPGGTFCYRNGVNAVAIIVDVSPNT